MELWQRFTNRARRTVLLAHGEATRTRAALIGTEHLLGALLQIGEGAAYQALDDLGVDLDAMQNEVKAQTQVGTEEVAGSEITFTPDAQSALQLAYAEARQRGDEQVGTGHILLGLVLVGKGPAHRILEHHMIDIGAAREAVAEALEKTREPRETPAQSRKTHETTMNYAVSHQQVPYTGEELRSHWLFHRFGLRGDAAAGFLGECEVTPEHMVDQADVAAGESIRAALMLHFIVEHFDTDLTRAILRQRLLVCLAQELLTGVKGVRRVGDDLFVGDRKLSVSIATASPVSTLIHFALNVDPAGAPVPAVGLAELGVVPLPFAELLLTRYVEECRGIAAARCKVRGVP
jgi:uncharacterized protein